MVDTLPHGPEFGNVDTETVTIQSGNAFSDAVEHRRKMVAGFIFPASMTSGSFNIDVSVDGGNTWHTLTDSSGSAVTVSVSTGDYVSLHDIDGLPGGLADFPHFRLSGGSAEGAERTITAVMGWVPR